MLPIPDRYRFALGASEGEHTLTAFDNALLEAGIGNVNLVRITSILPPRASEDGSLEPPYGALVPAAYGVCTSQEPGEIISAAVGVGLSGGSMGVIMEAAGRCSRQESEKKVAGMLEEAFATRGMLLEEVVVKGVEHRVITAGAALASVILWYRDG